MSGRCRVCEVAGFDVRFHLKENMFGTGERFAYDRCESCGCLQISKIPDNISDYYPDNYYSYSKHNASNLHRAKEVGRIALALHGPGWLFARQSWWLRGDFRSLRDTRARPSERILDIGCGRGDLIRTLADIGFCRLLGVDPFIESEISHSNGVRILRCDPSALQGEFDLIMLHHSFEHAWDQRRMASDVFRLLAPGGRCIVRIPTVDSWAWQEFGVEWVQADAPRHFYLHTRRSIAGLLETSGLLVTRIVDDSSGFQILGSEKIRRGLPLVDPKTGELDFAATLPAEMIGSSEARARALNSVGRGDAIAVHARRSS
jgi:SAM-dependent methyltransferase